MHPKTIAKQILDFNKAAFDSSFDAMNLWQSHAERMVQMFVEKANFFPEEGKKALTDWINAYKKGREDYKDVIDNSFQNVEDFFIKTTENMEYSIYGMIEKADASFSEVAHKIRNVSLAVVDKSMERIAGAPTQIDANKYEAVNTAKTSKGKTGRVQAATVSNAGKKPVKK